MCKTLHLQHKHQLTRVQDDCDSAPPSPELGMGSPSRSEVDDLELEEACGQRVTDADVSDTLVGWTIPLWAHRTDADHPRLPSNKAMMPLRKARVKNL